MHTNSPFHPTNPHRGAALARALRVISQPRAEDTTFQRRIAWLVLTARRPASAPRPAPSGGAAA